ncbi:MAG: DUF2061 domain-containing protein [Rhodospirillales bacterium]|nr:DUF2061 domain-containing protein [Rhodospirillales bacterium]
MAAKKTVTFAVVHFGVAFSVAYVLTGDVAVSGALALVEPACNTVAYYFHERAWGWWRGLRERAGMAGRRDGRAFAM